MFKFGHLVCFVSLISASAQATDFDFDWGFDADTKENLAKFEKRSSDFDTDWDDDATDLMQHFTRVYGHSTFKAGQPVDPKEVLGVYNKALRLISQSPEVVQDPTFRESVRHVMKECEELGIYNDATELQELRAIYNDPSLLANKSVQDHLKSNLAQQLAELNINKGNVAAQENTVTPPMISSLTNLNDKIEGSKKAISKSKVNKNKKTKKNKKSKKSSSRAKSKVKNKKSSKKPASKYKFKSRKHSRHKKRTKNR